MKHTQSPTSFQAARAYLTDDPIIKPLLLFITALMYGVQTLTNHKRTGVMYFLFYFLFMNKLQVFLV